MSRLAKSLDVHQLAARNSLNALADSLVAARLNLPNTHPTTPDIHSKKTSRYLVGSVGTGKSMLMDSFHASLNSRAKDLNLPPLSQRIHFLAFMSSIHSQLHEIRSTLPTRDPFQVLASNIIKKAPVLCLDEFQVVDIGDAMVLRRLLETLYSFNPPSESTSRNEHTNPQFSLVTTSNKQIQDLYGKGLNRSVVKPMLSLLESKCETLHLNPGLDYRRTSQSPPSKIQPFIHPQTPTESLTSLRTRFLSNYFQTQTPPPLPSPQNILLPSSRTLPIIHQTPGKSLLLHFTSLCGNAGTLGGADYIHLCKTYPTIHILGPVPRLSRDDTDAHGVKGVDLGRRFINFIDVAYDTHTRIFVESTHTAVETLVGLRPHDDAPVATRVVDAETTVKKEGGASSSGSATYVGIMEWSATGLQDASLSSIGGVGVSETGFAVERALSRVVEMGREGWGRALE
ncbi:hypothetical protein BCR33DRAFT_711278 [Rhizoclosmatium globosum]|uniref:AFG1-like ATPase n=1 Tax=Rhizoclosmatium globosum TaxID=329046 RepID=A0A1Y2D0Q1_9FUNG|nr:hypothetical protein BCR33DRAFT_711278 [Rhizoclosmatium globosum]|eukprot:ORY52852.1 hypothetical protein BCR33DRAFT_711278 [Rhizoclosmatium globosum]